MCYIFSIMLKGLAILGLAAFLLRGQNMTRQEHPPARKQEQISAAKQQQLLPAGAANSQQYAEGGHNLTTACKKNPDPPVFTAWWRTPEWVIVEVTAAYTGIALLTLFFIAAQVWLMRSTAQRQLRAYVLAETGTIVNVANPDKSRGPKFKTGAELAHSEWGPIVKIQIKNTGQTPAYDVVHWAAIYHRELPLKSPLPPMPIEQEFNKSPMGPGIPITKVLFFGPPLSVEQVTSLKDGSAAIYCQGIIRYRDTFMKKHFTRYRLMHCIHGGRIGVNTDLTFCEEGNDTDDTQIRWWKFWRLRSTQKHTNAEPEQKSLAGDPGGLDGATGA
ncbi:MAG: hypothetical protein ACYCO5_09290 [Acidobacteriaceae bacterium]